MKKWGWKYLLVGTGEGDMHEVDREREKWMRWLGDPKQFRYFGRFKERGKKILEEAGLDREPDY